MTDDLLVEREGPIALLTFNRPDARNAMTFEMYEALHDACTELDADPRTRVLVLKGAGDRAFASGTDIRQFVDFKTAQDALSYESRLTRVLSKLAGMSKPTVAMLQGDAIGGGLFIALACDLRLAAPHARFGVPVARTLGNFLAPVSLALLVAALGPGSARALVLTARLIDAAEAQATGLVDRIHPAPELERRARELAASLAELAPLTLAATKEATRRMLAVLTPRDLDDLILSCYLSRDFHEGCAPFSRSESRTGRVVEASSGSVGTGRILGRDSDHGAGGGRPCRLASPPASLSCCSSC
jgi:enoyl-CoA hydratase